MKHDHAFQYTVRGVPEALDTLLRNKAQEEGISLNKLIIAYLKRGLGISEEKICYNDLDDLAGTWVADPDFDDAMTEFNKIDDEMWK